MSIRLFFTLFSNDDAKKCHRLYSINLSSGFWLTLLPDMQILCHMMNIWNTSKRHRWHFPTCSTISSSRETSFEENWTIKHCSNHFLYMCHLDRPAPSLFLMCLGHECGVLTQDSSAGPPKYWTPSWTATESVIFTVTALAFLVPMCWNTSELFCH